MSEIKIKIENLYKIFGSRPREYTDIVRVGLEDNLYLEKGVYASNGQLVEKATTIISNLGANVMGPDEARKKLGLKV